jgi:hypothetical protein
LSAFYHESDEMATTARNMDLCLRVLQDAVNIKFLMILLDHITPSKIKHEPWLAMFDTAVANAKSSRSNSFHHLTYLLFRCISVHLEELECLFRLPSLATLQLQYIMPQNGPLQNWTIPASSCRIQELELSGCNLDSAAVAQIIGSLRAMTVFKYDHNRNWGPSDVHPPFSWRVIGDALRLHERFIRTLYLFDEEESRGNKVLSATSTTLGSLKNCHQLHNIRVPLHALYPDDIFLTGHLPANLAHAFLRIYPKHISAASCAALIESMKNVESDPACPCLDSNPRFSYLLFNDIPYHDLELWQARDMIAATGIEVSPTLMLTGYKGCERCVTLEMLRDMEADGYKDFSAGDPRSIEDGDGEDGDGDGEGEDGVVDGDVEENVIDDEMETDDG